MKPLTALLTATLLSTASLSACSESNMESRFKTNPNPQQAYRIKIKINDAPGPLKPTGDMEIGYAARNCSYVISEFAGATGNPEKSLYAELRQTGQQEYETVFYLDAMQNEDYFGQGVCRWQIEGFGFAFKATGKPEETAFNFGDFVNTLMEKKILTKYYWKARYPHTKRNDGSLVVEHTEFGSDSINDFSPENQKNLFTITVTLEEVKP